MTDHEIVLRDLLLDLGVEGVTLWHIRALAAYLSYLPARATGMNEERLFSDLRGEEYVRRLANETDMERTARLRTEGRMRRTAVEVSALYGAPSFEVVECDHHPNADCARCR